MSRQKRNSMVVKAVRAERARRGILRCEVCNWGPPPRLKSLGFKLEALNIVQGHHIVPVSEGGPDTADNLVLLCPNHHALAHRVCVVYSKTGKTKYWQGPTTREALIYELRLLQSSRDDEWTAWLASGRDYTAHLEKLEHDARIQHTRAFTVVDGGDKPRPPIMGLVRDSAPDYRL